MVNATITPSNQTLSTSRNLTGYTAFCRGRGKLLNACAGTYGKTRLGFRTEGNGLGLDSACEGRLESLLIVLQ